MGEGDVFIGTLRHINVFLGVIAATCLLLPLVKYRWSIAGTAQRLRFMSLIMLCFSITFGTYELLYLDSMLRVPMVTLSLTWAIVSALWPER